MSARLGIDVKPVAEAAEAVRGCDIVIAASSAKTPILKGE
jgi:ornithine cyclodeaminase/alanine dehydrogenase-like protein (mu-crystallin family)